MTKRSEDLFSSTEVANCDERVYRKIGACNVGPGEPRKSKKPRETGIKKNRRKISTGTYEPEIITSEQFTSGL